MLVRNGLFPTAPLQPRMAMSIELLDLYTAIFERSCDAVNAMAAALNSLYTWRGFYLVDDQVWMLQFQRVVVLTCILTGSEVPRTIQERIGLCIPVARQIERPHLSTC